MELVVHSRIGIESLPAQERPHVIVSITSTPEDRARLPDDPARRDVLRLSFLDLESTLHEIPEDALFRREHARQILDFALRWREHVERIVVHCDAGMSRSPAVAAALAHVSGRPSAPFFRQYIPNMLVYRTLLDVYEREYAEKKAER